MAKSNEATVEGVEGETKERKTRERKPFKVAVFSDGFNENGPVNPRVLRVSPDSIGEIMKLAGDNSLSRFELEIPPA